MNDQIVNNELVPVLEKKLAHATYWRNFGTHVIAAYYQINADLFAVAVFLPNGDKLLHLMEKSFTDPVAAVGSDEVKDALIAAIKLIRESADDGKTKELESQGITTTEVPK